MLIIVEGIDGAGKSTLVEYLKKHHNFKDVSFKYSAKDGFAKKYFNINEDSIQNGVADRSFISEIAKGNLVRGVCRLSDDEYESLLQFYSSLGAIVVYLKADKDTLLERRRNDREDFVMISNLYYEINEEYDKAIEIAKKYVQVYEFSTTNMDVEEIISNLKSNHVL